MNDEVQVQVKGELHIWEDGKAILTIVAGELRPEMAWAIVKGMKAANDDPKLLVFNFPVETIYEQGTIEYVGLRGR